MSKAEVLANLYLDKNGYEYEGEDDTFIFLGQPSEDPDFQWKVNIFKKDGKFVSYNAAQKINLRTKEKDIKDDKGQCDKANNTDTKKTHIKVS